MLHPRFLFLLPYLFVLLATVVNSAPVPRTTDCPSCSGLPRTLQSRGFLSSLFGCFKGAAEVEHTGPDPLSEIRKALQKSQAIIEELRAKPELSQLEQVELKNAEAAARNYQTQLLQSNPQTSNLYKAATSTSGL
ncbi:hypothetical protein A4X06_0g6218 [Tilletia controversa]|uniref:Uncharacterized protein n=1 Tax=Tilletia controversa TaxID=13291 RepID=A0A8X7SVE3_9BASI|nr:hypothetical protein A4X06_0g6218 [Tilletia controversa]